MSDDPYPGYGRRHRRLTEVLNDYQDECQDLASQVAALRKEFIEELQMIWDDVKVDFEHLTHLEQQRQSLRKRHKECLKTLATLADAIVHQYRQENQKYRSTPRPPYFSDDVDMPRKLELISSHKDETKIAGQRRIYDELPSLLRKRENDIQVAFSQFFTRLRTIEPSLDTQHDELLEVKI